MNRFEWEVAQEFPTDRPAAHHEIDLLLGAGKAPVRDEIGLVHRLIDFANGETNLAGLFTDTAAEGGVMQQREDARRLLIAAANAPGLLVEWINRHRQQHGDQLGVIRRPAFALDGRGRLNVSWSIGIDSRADGRSAAFAYVAALLLSDHDQCRTDLGLCRLPECGRFFMVERGKPGKPRRHFCDQITDGKGHMEIWHERDSARRHRIKKARDQQQKEAAARKRRRGASK